MSVSMQGETLKHRSFTLAFIIVFTGKLGAKH